MAASCSALLLLLAALISAVDYYPLYLAGQFRVQLLLAAAACLAGALTARDLKAVVLGGLAVAIHGWPVAAEWLKPLPPVVADPGSPRLKLMIANVLTQNSAYPSFVSAVERLDPDILIVEEYGVGWVEGLKPLSQKYPHQLLEPSNDNFGIGIWSRIPLGDARTETWKVDQVPYLLVHPEIGGISFELAAVHTLPPIPNFYPTHRAELEQIANWLATPPPAGGPRILAGDLNTGLWSDPYKKIIATGMHSLRDGHGVMPSWPRDKSPLLIPIDHILVTADVKPVRFERVDTLGSDHFGLFAEVVLSKSAVTPN